MTVSADILNHLRQKGYRMTSFKKSMMELFDGHSNPLSVSDILQSMDGLGVTVDQATVYRTLKTLVKEKLILEIDLGDRISRYESAFLEHHHHFTCNNCRAVEDIHLPADFERMVAGISKDSPFKILGHKLEFFGFCKNCIK